MKIVEWMIRALLTVPVVFSVILILLPLWGISVDVVLSGSMEPEIKTGGVVFTDTKDKEIQTGDILTYRLNEILVTHRVIGKELQGWITKGDANKLRDASPVTDSQIIGTVVWDIPYVGYVLSFLKKKTIVCLLAAVLVQEFIILLLNWKGERRKSLCEKRI